MLNLPGDMLNRFVESQIFFPDPFLVCTPAEAALSFEDVRFMTQDGVRLHGWLVPANPSQGLMLFCHGNAGNVSHRVDNIRRLHDIGLSVFIFDYRGYGQSEGTISEVGFYEDAEAAYQVARLHADRTGAKLVIFGRSLGGIAAVHIASRFPAEGIILESTFTHMAAMAKEHFPLPVPEGLLRHKLNALAKIPQVKAQTLFFHGDQDDIVPMRLGRELFEAATASKEWVTLEGAGHNDTYLVAGQAYFDKMEAFVRDLPEPSR
jgi:fermentation-respiration switch protein FrsA (DUF1100 family)